MQTVSEVHLRAILERIGCIKARAETLIPGVLIPSDYFASR